MKTATYNILWNGEKHEHASALSALFKGARHADIAVAFAKMSGWRHIDKPLTALLKRGGSARCMIGLDFCQSDPTLLSELLRLSQRFTLQVYVGRDSSYVFHPKIYRFEYADGSVASLVGSANWTNGGLSDNFECSVLLRMKSETALAKHLNALIANEDVEELTSPALSAYERRLRLRRQRAPPRSDARNDCNARRRPHSCASRKFFASSASINPRWVLQHK